MSNRFTEGLEKVGDRYRIHENVQISKEDLIEIPIKEGTIVEGAGDKKLVKSYRMNVWEARTSSGVSLNKNSRYYDPIFERVLKENPVTLALMNHPDANEDGNPKDIWAVQSKPMIENGWLTCQVDLVGQYGQLAEEILNAGGFISISSSCLGRVQEDGGIVNDISFALERFGDFVMNPSNGYQHFKSEMQETTKKAVTENSTIIVENNKIEEQVEEKTTMSDIRLVKLNLKGMIREAEKANSNKEKLVLLEEALSFCEGDELKDIRESVESKIVTISEAVQTRAVEADKLEETVKEKETEVSTIKEEVEAEKVKFTKVIAITESIKKDFNKNKALLESQTELKEEVESKVVILERDNTELIAKNTILERDLAEALKLKEMPEEMSDDDKKAMEDEMKDMTPEEKAEYKKKMNGDKKKESVESDSKVKNFYVDSVKANKDLRENREEILACGTLKEAQDLVLKITNLVEKTDKEVKHEDVNTKIEESGKKTCSSVLARLRENRL